MIQHTFHAASIHLSNLLITRRDCFSRLYVLLDNMSCRNGRRGLADTCRSKTSRYIHTSMHRPPSSLPPTALLTLPTSIKQKLSIFLNMLLPSPKLIGSQRLLPHKKQLSNYLIPHTSRDITSAHHHGTRPGQQASKQASKAGKRGKRGKQKYRR